MRSLIFILFLINFTNGLQILAIFPLSMKSHLAIGNSVIKSLLDVGHNVTAIATFKPDEPSDNYRVVQIPDVFEEFKEKEPNPFEYIEIPIILSIVTMPMFGVDTIHSVMRSEELKKFLESDEKFDICVMELFMSDALLGIPEKFECSLIYYITFDSPLWTDSVNGNESPSSYVPNPFLHYTDKMSFKERLWNGFISLIDKAVYYGYHLPYQRHLYNKYFPNAKRSFWEMYRNSSITFINNHVSYSAPRPHQPTQIEIGGIHVKPKKQLPKDFQEFLDSATDGAILFSMGSYIDGTDWKVEQREAFITAFGKLKQKIIWRYSNETLPNNPGNIKIGSWIPQRDILAHPNVKLFITHGGLLGTTEAMIEGIPVLGIPVFGDQMMNMAKAVTRGYGLQIRYKNVNEESITEALNQLLNNPKYKQNAELISKIFNDRPQTPQETVVYWTEYVARHQGAAHLQAESVNLSFIEYHSVDVFAVMIVLFLIILYIDYRILKCIFKRVFKKKDQKKKKTQ